MTGRRRSGSPAAPPSARRSWAWSPSCRSRTPPRRRGCGGAPAGEPAPRTGWIRSTRRTRCAPSTPGRSTRPGAPSLDLMERAGAGLARVTAAAAGDGPVVRRGRQGQQRRRRPGGGAATCARRATWSTCSPWRLPRSCAATPPANLERLPGEPPEPFAPERLEGAGRGRGRAAGHGLRGRAARAGGGRDRGDQRPAGAGGGLRRALGRGRLHRARWRARRCAPRSPRPSTARSSGSARRAGQTCTPGRSRWWRSASPAARRPRSARG